MSNFTLLPKRLVTLAQMARLSHVPSKWLRAEAEAGRLPCLNADGRLLFDREAVDAALLERARSVQSEGQR